MSQIDENMDVQCHSDPVDGNGSENDDELSDEWEEMEEGYESAKCLFCENSFKTFEEALGHLQIGHKLSVFDLQEKYSMDQYLYIKVVWNILENQRTFCDGIFFSCR